MLALHVPAELQIVGEDEIGEGAEVPLQPRRRKPGSRLLAHRHSRGHPFVMVQEQHGTEGLVLC